MDKLSTLAFDVASKFEKYSLSVFAQQMSAQPIDVKTAVAPALGLKSKGGGDFEFDVNSKPADVIFNAMEVANFKGDVHIALSVDASKKGNLVVTTNPSTDAGKAMAVKIANTLKPGVNSMLSKMKIAPADTITIADIVTASNG